MEARPKALLYWKLRPFAELFEGKKEIKGDVTKTSTLRLSCSTRVWVMYSPHAKPVNPRNTKVLYR